MIWKLKLRKKLQMKKFLAALMAMLMVFGMTGCGSGGDSAVIASSVPLETKPTVNLSAESSVIESEEEITDEYGRIYDAELGIYVYPSTESENEESTSAPESDRTGARPGADEGEVESDFFTEHLRNQVFTKISPFSEGRAWVQYLGANGETITSVINTNGEIVFTLDRKADYYYDFHDGFAYYLYTPDPTREREENLDNVAVCIVDRDGNITYDSQNDNIRAILSYGDGHFLAIEHISTFDIDEWRFGSIDKDGNTLTEFETYDTNKTVYLPIYRSTYDVGYFDQYFRYLDEGMFYLYSDNRGRLYNARERKIISGSVGTVTKVGHYQNGHMLYSGGGNSWWVWIYDTDGNKNDIEMRTHSNFDRSEIFLSGFSENMCFVNGK